MNPSVSVIVTNYNYARFVRRAVDSALTQTRPPDEVIVVDDGSTDDSRAVIDSLRGSVVAAFKENGGQASAFSVGFALSRGDIVVLLDADDVLFPDAIEEIVPHFTDPSIVRVQWHLTEIDENERPTGRLRPTEPLPDGDLRARMVEFGPGGVPTPPTSGNAWSRWVLEQCLPAPASGYRISADFYLVQLSSALGSIRSCGRSISGLRVHGSNNYSTLPLAVKIRNDMVRYEDMSARLATYFDALDLPADVDRWKRLSGWYKYMVRVEEGISRLARLIPPGAVFALVDDGSWLREEVTEVFADRLTVPFLLSSGPVTDPDRTVEAIHEVERLRRASVRYIVFVPPATRWFRNLPWLRSYLEVTARCLAKGDVVVFDLGAPGAPDDIPPPAWLPDTVPIVTVGSAVRAREVALRLRYRPFVGDRELVLAIEQQRRKGARYFVIREAEGWWLDLHPSVRDHLETRYGRARAGGGCLVYELVPLLRPTRWRRILSREQKSA